MNAEITLVGAEFVQRFSATRRGARLARRLAVHQLDEWGVPYGSELSDDAAVIVSELAANAVLHGLVAGRDFELRLVVLAGTLRIEVSDARGERGPEPQPNRPGAESGYGLHLVEALATSWGVKDRGVGKTVWAELATTP
ncbi:ATP-binding protein [Streptomyces sp. Ncost-T10-10d]|uniref:ATP-binding protein n=1 Tax=Streptomyces sp. Ncost-T10-10d TaxID=1839774 RepID=UPI00081E5305|nr:ATP-binding protein [Streptomyces sp. Ncost-T10-10d]SCF58774.1 Anti-sigma regulatory factor (Ser/Thr protein kinase) [Streptomyces sp. Ncost-T10-10d]